MGYIAELRALVGHRPLVVAIAAVVVLDDAGAVLLHRRGDGGRWSVPGGVVEPGESLEDVARRELGEETGLTAGVVPLVLLDVFSGPECFHRYPNGDQTYFVGATYAVERPAGTSTPDGAEATELPFFPLDALPADLLPISRVILDRCRARARTS